jgi:hypothetical protein
MKTFLIIISIALVLFSCKKDETPKTTYYIVNETTVSLDNLVSGFWNGNDFTSLEKHGSLAPSKSTNKIETKYEEITVGFSLAGKTILVINPYKVTKEIDNKFIIDGNTKIYSLENGKKVLISLK